MAKLISKKIDEEFVSLRELGQELHADPRTIKTYMSEMGWHFPFRRKDKDIIINYVNRRRKEKKIENEHSCIEKPVDEAVKKADDDVISVEKFIKKKKDYGYHVSIRGRLGWIVVHIGPKEEMEAWQNLFLRNDIESKVDENQKILMAYDMNLNK